MLWYGRLSSLNKAADKPNEAPPRPPAYIEERISDLSYAQEFLYKDPGTARRILAAVSDQLSQHHDDGFLEPIKEAVEMLRQGSPAKALVMIDATKKAMRAELDIKEVEEKTSWKKPARNLP